MDHQHAYNGADRQLVERVLGGDTEAFSLIIKHTERLVAQLLFKMIDRAEDRKDLTQDIYFKVFHQLKGFRFKSKLSTWIAQIAYHTCLDYLSKRKIILVDNWPEGTEPVAQDTEQILFDKALSDILKREIEKLPPLYRTLIMLYHQEDQSYAAIAEITDLPVGTVKSYLYRGRQQLRDKLLLTYKKREAL